MRPGRHRPLRSSRQRLQAILVVQSRKDRRSGDAVAGSNVMPTWTRKPLGRFVGNAWTEAAVRSPVVVVSHPLPQDEPKMSFIQYDQPIQTLSPDRADQPLAERIRLWASAPACKVQKLGHAARTYS
jgi:hypothetical protein